MKELQEPQEYKLNGGEILAYISQYLNNIPTIIHYEVLPNPTEKRAKLRRFASETKINRYGYKQNGIIYFQEIGGNNRQFQVIDKSVEDLQAKIDTFYKVQKTFERKESFFKCTLEQLQRIDEIINENAVKES